MVKAHRSVSLHFKRLSILLMVGASPILYFSDVFAGNKEMVEEAAQELDELNKEAVRRIPELPSHGQVKLETNVSYQNGLPIFDFTSKRITTEKSQEIHFDAGQIIPAEESTGRK